MLIGGVCAVAILAIGGGVFGVLLLLRDDFRLTSPPLASSEARLVLDWPAEDRGAAMVHINGRKRSLPGAGRVSYSLPSGSHRVVLQRRGYEPIQVSLELQPGETHRYAPRWKAQSLAEELADGALMAGDPVPPGFEGWTQRYDAALRQAAREKNDVLVAFVGSDWDNSSAALAQRVFPDVEFHRRAKEGLVLVVVDLPQSQEAYEQILDSAQNAMLRSEFGVSPDTIPTMVLLDSQGRPYVVEENYEAATPGQFLSDLDQWRSLREQRDHLFAQVDESSGAGQLRSAVKAVEWLREHGLTRFYGGLFRQWEAIGLKEDPANAAGEYEVLFEANWFARWYGASQNEDVPLIERLVGEFNDWRNRFTFQNSDRAGRMHLVAAATMYQLGRREDAARHIEHGLAVRPKDRKLLAQLQGLSEIFRGELATGTGFVVAPGYVLTNHHVIDGAARVVVVGSGSEVESDAEIVAHDEERDVALLRVSGDAAALPPLMLSGAPVGRGARVAAFGYPLGDTLGRGLKLTTGVVSSLPDAAGGNMYLLDCRVNPGNSGGPLCDQFGRVVGMVTAKSGSSESVDSYGMALPADVMQAFLSDHLPGGAPAAAEAHLSALEWDEVDRTVSSSVLMVVRKE